MPVRPFIIVPAAGAGARFGAAAPKKYSDLYGQPVLWHTL
jgi:2-C-methyl-D-erythritol 4-phosphate cytidylyltransferase